VARSASAATAIGVLLAVTTFSSCGGDDDGKGESSADARLRAAADVSAADFPAAGGRTLEEIAATARPGVEVGLATSVYTTGENRFAFGLIDQAGKPVIGKSAVYLARAPGAPAEGPFPAPLGSMVAERPFRSRTVTQDEGSPKTIYATRVRLERPGRYFALAVSKQGDAFVGATTEIRAARSSRIPEPGERAPAIETPTVESVGSDIEKIETRVPPDSMHEVSFRDAVGERPVALLFATPALCHSRTCGPVVDLAEQLKADFGRQVTFIHQEVYVGNDPNKGLRPQLRAFRLQTEPWLFTVDREGRVAARLEGAFGLEEMRQAVEAALR
jgi:hypothetical protein